MRFAALVLLAAGLSTSALRAQDPVPPGIDSARAIDSAQAEEILDTLSIDDLPIAEPEERLSVETGPPWQLSYFPFITYGSNDGFLLAGRVRYWQPAEYTDRVTYRGALQVDAGANAKGSRFFVASFRAPLLGDGWRLAVVGAARREARFEFYGLGNDTEIDESLTTDAQPFFYRVRRTAYRASATVTRRLRGPFHVAVGGGIDRVEFDDLPGPTLFRDTFGGDLEETDASAQLAFLFDTRDNEFNTTSGTLLEAGVQAGSGGSGYTRYYTALRGYLPVREGTIVAGRAVASYVNGTPPLDARLYVPLWDEPASVFGGAASNRGYDRGRFIGRHTVFTNLEVRQDVFAFGDLGAVGLVGFVDAGRVFETEEFQLPGDDWKLGAGAGVSVRLLRSTIFLFNFAGGEDGFEFSVGSGWMF